MKIHPEQAARIERILDLNMDRTGQAGMERGRIQTVSE
jgi:hypothetical protein